MHTSEKSKQDIIMGVINNKCEVKSQTLIFNLSIQE